MIRLTEDQLTFILIAGAAAVVFGSDMYCRWALLQVELRRFRGESLSPARKSEVLAAVRSPHADGTRGQVYYEESRRTEKPPAGERKTDARGRAPMPLRSARICSDCWTQHDQGPGQCPASPLPESDGEPPNAS